MFSNFADSKSSFSNEKVSVVLSRPQGNIQVHPTICEKCINQLKKLFEEMQEKDISYRTIA